MIGNFSYIPKVFCYWFMFLNICFWFFRLFFFPCRCVDKLFVEEENWESAVAEWEWACQRCVHSASTEDVWSKCSWMKRAGRVLWLYGRERVNSVHSDSTEDVWSNCSWMKRAGKVLWLFWRERVNPVHSDSSEDVWTSCLQRKRSGRVWCLHERELCQLCAQWQHWRCVDKQLTEEEKWEGIVFAWERALSALCTLTALKMCGQTVYRGREVGGYCVCMRESFVNPVHSDSTEDLWTSCLLRKRTGRVLRLYGRVLCQLCAQCQHFRHCSVIYKDSQVGGTVVVQEWACQPWAQW